MKHIQYQFCSVYSKLQDSGHKKWLKLDGFGTGCARRIPSVRGVLAAQLERDAAAMGTGVAWNQAKQEDLPIC